MKNWKRYLLGSFGGTLAAAALAFAYTTTSDMSLKIPAAGDSDYPTSISDSFTLIDAHDHTSGKGVVIPAGGLATNSVTTAKIVDSNVTGAKLASSVADGTTLEYSGTSIRIKDSGVSTAKVENAAITQEKLAARATGTSVAAGGVAISASSGSFSTNSTSYTDVTNLSVTIVTTGRPVKLALQGADTSGSFTTGGVLGNSGGFSVAFLRDGSIINTQPGSANAFPAGMYHFVDTPAAGTYIYKVQLKSNSGANSPVVNNCKLVAYEL